MKLLSVVALVLASANYLADAYPITGTSVNCQSGPGTNYSVKKTYQKGCQVEITCQTPGTNIFGNNIWDKTADGCYVTDYYVKTGTNDYITKKCGEAGGYCKNLNAAGKKLIKQWEGLVPSPGADPIGLPTVGYGHLCQTKKCSEVEYKFPLTQATASQLLNDDIPKYTQCLASYLNNKVTLNANQWAALTSWAFNVGCWNIKTSQLIKRLNQGQNPNTVAAQELPKWRLAGGKIMQGLVNRRKAEVKLFKKPSAKQAHPRCQ
ncbi:hypothetical protein GGF46_003826 [Coemansia sp. RSA 552]|nr:hypothetical protein GGF46_003826 [Coemansia sp. RSA 552]